MANFLPLSGSYRNGQIQFFDSRFYKCFSDDDDTTFEYQSSKEKKSSDGNGRSYIQVLQ